MGGGELHRGEPVDGGVSVRIPSKSYWARGCRVLTDDDGKQYFGPRKLIDAPSRSDDRTHTVKTGDTIAKLAWTYFRDPALDWIIADYAIQDGHRMLFPDRDMQPGMVLRIPSEAVAQRIIGTTEQ